ncbi:signal peptidase I [Microbulbifer flavimaris]|uniref:Signal peptidase I n=1 Tax=Microbulbifer flavimaris TaxID=1781068 RepID=A0ABX4I213_9GAMM|nr:MULTISPECIES: signal peptidase I [Microbulbifer]KUJ84367.1 S26 family signal peptidase [Microbulbifer sp. ZGT114]PCO06450.1 signal peptidase I [Microbulbifer flavimaris]
MDINFPLILLWLVVITGAIWLVDSLFFARRRQQDAEEPVLVEYAKSFFPVLAIVFILRSFVVEPFQIPSRSMVPTLQVGDFILVNKYAYGLRLPISRKKVLDIGEPERGDVMVFFPPHMNETYYIKRVIGLPGDEIRIEDNVLYINGERASQELIQALPPANPQVEVMWEEIDGERHLMARHIEPSRFANFSGVVPEGHYFMVGDNRDNSLDSREWGFVPERDIVGKAFAIWMHWEDLFSLPSFERVGSIQ